MDAPLPGTQASGMVPGAPRRARLRSAFGPLYGVLFFVGAFASLVLGTMSIGFTTAGRPFWEDSLLDAHAKEVDATPFAVEETRVKINRATVVRIRFRFKDAEGRERTGASLARNRGLVERARRGETLPAEYDPGNPARARIVDTKLAVMGPGILFIYAFALAGIGVTVFTARAAFRRRALYVSGEATTARVVSVTRTNVRVNGRPLLAIAYTFQGPYGPVEGVMKNVEAPHVGAEVAAVYDPRAPERSVLVRPTDFR